MPEIKIPSFDIELPDPGSRILPALADVETPGSPTSFCTWRSLRRIIDQEYTVELWVSVTTLQCYCEINLTTCLPRYSWTDRSFNKASEHYHKTSEHYHTSILTLPIEVDHGMHVSVKETRISRQLIMTMSMRTTRLAVNRQIAIGYGRDRVDCSLKHDES